MATSVARKLDVTTDIAPAVTPQTAPAVTPPVVTVFQTQEWMSNPWVVSTTDILGVATLDTLRLRTNGTIAIQKSSMGERETWATWGTACQLTCAGLSGVTMDNKPFQITFTDDGEIKCTILGLPSGISQFNHKPGPDQTWTSEEGGAGTIGLPDSQGGHSQL